MKTPAIGRGALQAAAARRALSRARRNGAAGRRRERRSRLTPFALPEGQGRLVIDCRRTRGPQLRPRARRRNRQRVRRGGGACRSDLQAAGHHVILGSWSDGSRDRLCGVLADHGLEEAAADQHARRRERAEALAADVVAGGAGAWRPASTIDRLAVISRERHPRRPAGAPEAQGASARRTSSCEVQALAARRPRGPCRPRHRPLRRPEDRSTAAGAPHDCLELQYAGGLLLLPVENIELLTRYGSEDAEVALDRLGGGAWQARKARMKKRILEMAGELIKVAAAALREAGARASCAPEGLYDEFAARFAFDETEDQATAIDAVLDDLNGGPADGPAGLRRRRLRQDRGGAARRLRGGDLGQAGRGGGAHHPARAPALPDLRRALQGPAASRWRRPRASSRPRR